MPPRNLELSVAHTDSLNEADVWRLGSKFLGKTVLGRADLKAAQFVSLGLNVSRDDRPKRHAVVRGWPLSQGDDKSLQIQIAQELARMANESKSVVLRG